MRTRTRGTVAIGAALALLATSALAAEYRSIGTAGAILWDGPSDKGRKLFVAPRGMPVEVLSSLPAWVKVRDLTGDAFWVLRTDLGTQRTVVAATQAVVRNAPQDTAASVFQVERGVILDLVEPAPTGWARVRHRDGLSGWVKATDVWGL